MIVVSCNSINIIALFHDAFGKQITLDEYRCIISKPEVALTKTLYFTYVSHHDIWTEFAFYETLIESLLNGDVTLQTYPGEWTFELQGKNTGDLQWTTLFNNEKMKVLQPSEPYYSYE